ncbi:MAG: hypothetical protein ABIP54_02250 [Candidatus Andersenbacteria bacterium]
MTTQNKTNNYGTRATGYLNYNPTTTTIRLQKNISSVTYVGVGKYTLNFASTYTDGNYATLCTISNTSIPNTLTTAFIDSSSVNPSTTACNVAAAGTAFQDETYFTVAIIGV